MRLRNRQIPAAGWRQILKRAWAEAKADQVPLPAAGVAFFGFLSLFPAMIAAVLTYGLVAAPDRIRSQADELAAALPGSARELLLQQVEALTSAPQQALGIGLIISLLTALWSASGGVGYEVSTPVRIVLEVGRVLLAVVLMSVALAITYRLAPDRDAPRLRWVSIGATVATVTWLIVSAAFSLYVETFGNYAKTYGSLAAVVVLMLWLWLTVYAVLLGAEINAESEEQTVRDTTKGPPQPLGERNAVKADSVP